MTLRRRDKSGVYYFRFFWQNKEFTRSLFTKNYKEARQHLKNLEKIVMSEIKNQPALKEWQVKDIFDKYVQEAKLPTTEQGFKSRSLRLENYKANTQVEEVDIGLLSEIKILKKLLENYSSLKADEKLKNLKRYKKQIKPLIQNYDELATANNAYMVFYAQQQLAEYDRKNYNILPNIELESITLKQAYDNYTTAKKAKDLKKLSMAQLKSRLELMLNILSNYDLSAPLNGFGVFDYERIQEIISEYPINANQRNQIKHLIYSPLELVAQAKMYGIPAISRKTANEYLTELNSFLNYCLKKRFITHNHLDFSGRGKKNNKNTRKPYCDEDIINLFNSPIFTSEFEKTVQKKPEWHWIVLLAMFTGARLTEICQLRAKDIDINQKTINFQESEDEENSLKNINSTRMIPICDYLVNCGFWNMSNIKKSCLEMKPFYGVGEKPILSRSTVGEDILANSSTTTTADISPSKI